MLCLYLVTIRKFIWFKMWVIDDIVFTNWSGIAIKNNLKSYLGSSIRRYRLFYNKVVIKCYSFKV